MLFNNYRRRGRNNICLSRLCRGRKLLSDPCIVEIDRIPISIRERIIKLINV